MENTERVCHIKLIHYIDSLIKEKHINNKSIDYEDLAYGLISKSVIDNKLEEVKYILNEFYISQLDIDLLLILANKHKHTKIVEYLISEGANAVVIKENN